MWEQNQFTVLGGRIAAKVVNKKKVGKLFLSEHTRQKALYPVSALSDRFKTLFKLCPHIHRWGKKPYGNVDIEEKITTYMCLYDVSQPRVTETTSSRGPRSHAAVASQIIQIRP